jgi:hypothetical protein
LDQVDDLLLVGGQVVVGIADRPEHLDVCPVPVRARAGHRLAGPGGVCGQRGDRFGQATDRIGVNPC